MKDTYKRTEIEIIKFLEEDVLNGSQIILEEDETPIDQG